MEISKRYSPKNLAEIIGVHPETIRRLCRAKKLGYLPVGTNMQISIEDWKKYEERYGVEPR